MQQPIARIDFKILLLLLMPGLSVPRYHSGFLYTLPAVCPPPPRFLALAITAPGTDLLEIKNLVQVHVYLFV